MNIDMSELRRFVRGALRTETDERGRLLIRRFTPEQEEEYARVGRIYLTRCRACAGVTLDMITEADRLAFEYDVSSDEFQTDYSFDLFVDDVLTGTKTRKPADNTPVLFELPEGRHRVSVCFPWNVEIMLRSFFLSGDAAPEEAPQKKLRILTIGDSITQGAKVRHPGFAWPAILSRDLEAEVLNQGVGGTGFFAGDPLRSIPWKADRIVLAHGTNDYGRFPDAEKFRAAAENYMEKLMLLYPALPILQILPVYREDERHQIREKTRSYTLRDAREILRDIAQRYAGDQLTTLEIPMPHDPDFFHPDFLHPNDAGALFYEEYVFRALSKMISGGEKRADPQRN